MKNMITKTQDPKFFIIDGRLCGQSGPVPDDEPLFILRGRDINAAFTIDAYYKWAKANGADAAHLQAVHERLGHFQVFAATHPQRMKKPDTNLMELHDGKPEPFHIDEDYKESLLCACQKIEQQDKRIMELNEQISKALGRE
jgi:hypothetical protein